MVARDYPTSWEEKKYQWAHIFSAKNLGLFKNMKINGKHMLLMIFLKKYFFYYGPWPFAPSRLKSKELDRKDELCKGCDKWIILEPMHQIGSVSRTAGGYYKTLFDKPQGMSNFGSCIF